jgi:hypothetical protein
MSKNSAAPPSARRHVIWDLPAVIEPGRQGQSDLAHDLGPEMQREGGVALVFIEETRPSMRTISHRAHSLIRGGVLNDMSAEPPVSPTETPHRLLDDDGAGFLDKMPGVGKL